MMSQDQFLLLPLIHVEQMQVSDAVASIYTCIHTPELLCNFAKTLVGEGSFSLQVDPSDSTRNSCFAVIADKGDIQSELADTPTIHYMDKKCRPHLLTFIFGCF